MSKNDQKRLGIGAAIVLIAVLILLLLRKRHNTVYNQSGNVVLGGVNVPGYNFGPRSPFVIPGLNAGQPWERLSAIGACCSDCAGSAPRTNYAPASPALTIVFNEGNKGPNVYNYINPSPPAPKLSALPMSASY
jgi:hypothetical protein